MPSWFLQNICITYTYIICIKYIYAHWNHLLTWNSVWMLKFENFFLKISTYFYLLNLPTLDSKGKKRLTGCYNKQRWQFHPMSQLVQMRKLMTKRAVSCLGSHRYLVNAKGCLTSRACLTHRWGLPIKKIGLRVHFSGTARAQHMRVWSSALRNISNLYMF